LSYKVSVLSNKKPLRVVEHPRGTAHTDLEVTVDISKNTAPEPHPSTEEPSHGCYDGLVFIGHMIEEDGEEVEVFESVPCRRCASNAGVEH
jgi:hypothetical protein